MNKIKILARRLAHPIVNEKFKKSIDSIKPELNAIELINMTLGFKLHKICHSMSGNTIYDCLSIDSADGINLVEIKESSQGLNTAHNAGIEGLIIDLNKCMVLKEYMEALEFKYAYIAYYSQALYEYQLAIFELNSIFNNIECKDNKYYMNKKHAYKNGIIKYPKNKIKMPEITSAY